MITSLSLISGPFLSPIISLAQAPGGGGAGGNTTSASGGGINGTSVNTSADSIAVDRFGSVWVADSVAHTIQKFNLNGSLLEKHNAVNKIFNIGTGKATSIKSLYEILKDLLKRKNVQAKYSPPRLGDIRHSVASIEKAKDILEYQPKVNILEGLENVVDYYRH